MACAGAQTQLETPRYSGSGEGRARRGRGTPPMLSCFSTAPTPPRSGCSSMQRCADAGSGPGASSSALAALAPAGRDEPARRV